VALALTLDCLNKLDCRHVNFLHLVPPMKCETRILNALDQTIVF
jgi:hypothetical protein